jgi:hypothetical protein
VTEEQQRCFIACVCSTSQYMFSYNLLQALQYAIASYDVPLRVLC